MIADVDQSTKRRVDTKDREIVTELSELEKRLPAAAPAKALKSGMAAPRESRAAEVKAASHDDNEEFAYYLKFCDSTAPYVPLNAPWNVNDRYVLRVVDPDNKPVFGATVSLGKKGMPTAFFAATEASGEVVVFPHMDLGPDYANIRDYSLAVNGKPLDMPAVGADRQLVQIPLDYQRQAPAQLGAQVCFLLDATGSMADEIQQLKDVIFSIYTRLKGLPSQPRLEFSVVAYRDRRDDFLVKGHAFTDNIDTFQAVLEPIEAGGGGDEPEDVDAGLRWTLKELKWKPDATKFIFLVADAPPHLDYGDQEDYLWASRCAREKGIMICPIGASGLPLTGEFIFRQMAILTNGEFVFLHYGESGESDGAGTAADPGKVSHHTGGNYSARRLDDIVVDIVSRELGYLTDDARIVRTCPRPQDESDLLDARVDNLLAQVLHTPASLDKKAVIVAPVAYQDSLLGPLSEYLWNAVLEKTVTVSPLKVIERNRLQEVLKEQAMTLTGAIDPAAESKIGRLLSADYILFSNLQFLGSVRVCHARLVDCANGSVLSASRIKL
jgi:Mg-chelatase subunit ChlD